MWPNVEAAKSSPLTTTEVIGPSPRPIFAAARPHGSLRARGGPRAKDSRPKNKKPARCRSEPPRRHPVVSSLPRDVWPDRIQALFFGDFLLGHQKKVTRPPGRDPAMQQALDQPWRKRTRWIPTCVGMTRVCRRGSDGIRHESRAEKIVGSVTRKFRALVLHPVRGHSGTIAAMARRRAGARACPATAAGNNITKGEDGGFPS